MKEERARDDTLSGPKAAHFPWPLGWGGCWLWGRLALQNLGRRPARTLLLALAVAVSSGSVFATATLIQGIEASMALGFSRLGADLLVVPKETLVNITAALLTVEPSQYSVDGRIADEITRIPGVRRVAPQRFFRSSHSHSGITGQTDLIAFDPQHDFTVLPWLREKLDRPIRKGDVIIGRLRDYKIGEPVFLYGQSLTIYGRLGRTGVGTYDHAFFLTFETAKALAHGSRSNSSVVPLQLEPGKISALLIQLDVGATPEAVRFAIAKHPEIKVVEAGSPITSTRQALTALFGGTLALALIMLLGIALMLSVVFSAIIVERRQELGLLRAIGAKKRQVGRMIVGESALVTGLGGLVGVALGVVLLGIYRRSLIFHFEIINVPFVWPTVGSTLLAAVGCVLLAALVGVLGALYPAWRTGRQEPYDLIRLEG